MSIYVQSLRGWNPTIHSLNIQWIWAFAQMWFKVVQGCECNISSWGEKKDDIKWSRRGNAWDLVGLIRRMFVSLSDSLNFLFLLPARWNHRGAIRDPSTRAGGPWGGERGCQGCVLVGPWMSSAWMNYPGVTGAWLECFKRPGFVQWQQNEGLACVWVLGRPERACLDSECHRVLYSHLECPVSSPMWAVLSVRTAMISHCNLSQVKCLRMPRGFWLVCMYFRWNRMHSGFLRNGTKV